MLREKTLTITADNRDRGKQFLLKEKPALQVEKWAARAFLALVHSGLEVPDDVTGKGVIGLALFLVTRSLAGVPFSAIEPLLDEMLACVQIVPDPKNPFAARALLDTDIEEVSTLIYLRREVAELHLGFSLADARSRLISMAAPAASSNAPTSPVSSPAS